MYLAFSAGGSVRAAEHEQINIKHKPGGVVSRAFLCLGVLVYPRCCCAVVGACGLVEHGITPAFYSVFTRGHYKPFTEAFVYRVITYERGIKRRYRGIGEPHRAFCLRFYPRVFRLKGFFPRFCSDPQPMPPNTGTLSPGAERSDSSYDGISSTRTTTGDRHTRRSPNTEPHQLEQIHRHEITPKNKAVTNISTMSLPCHYTIVPF